MEIPIPRHGSIQSRRKTNEWINLYINKLSIVMSRNVKTSMPTKNATWDTAENIPDRLYYNFRALKYVHLRL